MRVEIDSNATVGSEYPTVSSQNEVNQATITSLEVVSSSFLRCEGRGAYEIFVMIISNELSDPTHFLMDSAITLDCSLAVSTVRPERDTDDANDTTVRTATVGKAVGYDVGSDDG